MKELVTLLEKPPELVNSASSTATSRVTRTYRRGQLLAVFSLIKSLIRMRSCRGGAAAAQAVCSLIAGTHALLHTRYFLPYFSFSFLMTACKLLLQLEAYRERAVLGLKCLQNQGRDASLNVLLFIVWSPEHSTRRGCSAAELVLPPEPGWFFILPHKGVSAA